MRSKHTKKRHTVRNVILTIILVLLVSVGAYAARKYYNLKHAVDNTYQSAGIKKIVMLARCFSRRVPFQFC